jgi:hypothetical protein
MVLDKHKIWNQALNINLTDALEKPTYHSLCNCTDSKTFIWSKHVLKNKHVQVSVCLLPSVGLYHVGIFSRQTTRNCKSNTYLALCLQLLLALVAHACVVLAEPQGQPRHRPPFNYRIQPLGTWPSRPRPTGPIYVWGTSLGLVQEVRSSGRQQQHR